MGISLLGTYLGMGTTVGGIGGGLAGAAISSATKGGKGGKAPPPPEPVSDPQLLAQASAKKRRQDVKGQISRSDTILTGPSGITEEPTSSATTMLLGQ